MQFPVLEIMAQGSTPAAEVIRENLVGARLTIREALSLQFLGNSYGQLLACFAVLMITLVLRRVLVGWMFNRLKWFTSRTSSRYDDRFVAMTEAPAGGLLLVIGIFTAIKVLTLPPEADTWLDRLFFAATLVVVFWALIRLVDFIAIVLENIAKQNDSNLHSFVPLIKKAARIFIVIIGVVLVIQNLGYSVGSLLAGLGIGGLAVALAAQDSLSNFFGSIVVAADQSFKVGDWIQMGDVDGNVEEIGLRSTKIRTFAKTMMVIPNKKLADEVVENLSRMPKRRVKQTIGVTYDTTPEKMNGLLADIRQLLREDESVHQELILVNFTDFGASSLDILVYYFTVTTAWKEHLNARERVNLKIMKAVEARGLAFAFPTRTIHFEGEIANRMAGQTPG